MPKGLLSGSRVRALRASRGLGQAELARRVGVSPSYLNLIEHNRRRAGARLLAALAQALDVTPETLDEGAGDALVAALRAAGAFGAQAGSGGVPPEEERAEEFAGRFPGWAGLVATFANRAEAQERAIERLNDRMAHDPNLSAALHEIVSAVTAVQSTVAILVETPDLEPEWRSRFEGNIHADSRRLGIAAEALVAYLDEGATEASLASPLEELESWLTRIDYHLPALEDPGADLGALVDGQPELASVAARALARDWLARAATDAARLPMARLLPALTAAGRGLGAPEGLAQALGVDLALLFRRLALLPPLPHLPRFGLVVCDGSGTLTFRRALPGFALPRFGGACPLWPLFQALTHPARPLRALLEVPGRPVQTFLAHAIAGPRTATGFDLPPVWESAMLISAHPVAADAPAPLPVGTSCRVCPRMGCPARREPSIVVGTLR